jgi:hypothetical protein
MSPPLTRVPSRFLAGDAHHASEIAVEESVQSGYTVQPQVAKIEAILRQVAQARH